MHGMSGSRAGDQNIENCQNEHINQQETMKSGNDPSEHGTCHRENVVRQQYFTQVNVMVGAKTNVHF